MAPIIPILAKVVGTIMAGKSQGGGALANLAINLTNNASSSKNVPTPQTIGS